MRSLYLRIWLTVVAALALFALVSGAVVQSHLDSERARFDSVQQERFAAWADLLERSLPGAAAPRDEQAAAVRDWSQRLRLPLALDDAAGRRIVASDIFLRREGERASGSGSGGGMPVPAPRMQSIRLDDGRMLHVMRPLRLGGGPGRDGGPPGGGPRPRPPWLLPGLPDGGIGLAALLLVLFGAVAAGAWPVVRRLTRRLEALKRGVEAFGAGQLQQRVAADGRDEVAALATSFNNAAARIEALLRSHQTLLANASHELRSPLARLKMAVAMLDDTATPAAQRAAMRREIDTDIAELDALVEEVLLASRLDAATTLDRREPVEMLALAAEEAARVRAAARGGPGVAGANGASEAQQQLVVHGDERLLRRAVRNLLENARRYGGDSVEVQVAAGGAGGVEVQVADRGPGVPEGFRERIFEPFFRLPGHAEREGGVGLGLALVRQIAERHGGSVRCDPRAGGGSCFTLALPAAA